MTWRSKKQVTPVLKPAGLTCQGPMEEYYYGDYTLALPPVKWGGITPEF